MMHVEGRPRRTMRPWLLLLLGLAAGCAPRTAQPVWLGHVAPLSGGAAGSGEEAARALQLDLEALRAEGWTVAGRTLGVRHADAADAERGSAGAVRLLAVNRVSGLIVGPGVTNAEAVLLATRPQGAAVVCLDEVPGPAGEGEYLLGADPVQRGRVLARQAPLPPEKARVVQMIDRDDRIATTAAVAFRTEWRKRGGRLEERDIGGEPPAQADLVFVAASGTRATALLDRLAGKLPAEANFLLGGAEDDTKARASWRQAVYRATIYTPLAELSEPTATWKKRYEERYQQPPGRAAFLAHDGLQFLLGGLRDLDDPTRAALLETLGQPTQFDSFSGKVVWEEGRPRRTLFLIREQRGAQALIATVPAEEPGK